MSNTDTPDLRVDQIVQYTDPGGRTHDAVIDEIVGDSVVILFRPRIVARHRLVDRSTLEVPE